MTNQESIIKNQRGEEKDKMTLEDLEDLVNYIEEFSAFLPLAVCTINPLEKIISINKSFENLTNYQEIEIVGQEIQAIFAEEKKVRQLLTEVQKKEKITSELTLITKQKKEIPVSASFSLRKDREGKFIGYFLALNDITEFKKIGKKIEEEVKKRTKELEEARRALVNILEDIEQARRIAEEERNKTLAVITNFTDGLLVFDKENNLSLINPQAEMFFEVKAKDLIGRSISELSTFPTIEPLVKLLGREIQRLYRQELQIKETLILEVSTIPLIAEQETLGNVVILHDITREKLIERMKSEFVSLAAHQLRTPLSAIKWTLRMLIDGDLGEISPQQRTLIERTYRANERMISLINDLLNVTRIEEGRYLYKTIWTNIEPIIQFVINAYQEEVKRRKLTVEFIKPKEKLPRVIVDPEKIQLAIQNLFDNAVRYNKPGGKVTISLKRSKNEIEVSIQDTGVGIPKDQQERVFVKFFRAPNVMRMETEGTGLGLFIAKNIIEAHGGKIWFESEENEGTTFYFSLPIKEEFEEFLKEF